MISNSINTTEGYLASFSSCFDDMNSDESRNIFYLKNQIITNSYNFVKDVSVVFPIRTNDHCRVSVYILRLKRKLHVSTLFGIIKTAFPQFKQALSTANFAECFTLEEVDEACTKQTDIFPNMATAHVPKY